MSETKIQRAMTLQNIYTKKRDLMPFTGEWLDCIGKPELAGSWIIWGGSGHGKTSFVMKLCKYLTKFGKVLYDSLEEGNSESFKLALQDAQMEEVEDSILFLDKEPMDELKIRLRKHKAPRIVIIDSFQYTFMKLKEYKAMLNEFPKVLFILISHADGKEPKGDAAVSIRYDAMVKIRVYGFMAFCLSRYKRGKSKPIPIWLEGAIMFHGEVPETSEEHIK